MLYYQIFGLLRILYVGYSLTELEFYERLFLLFKTLAETSENIVDHQNDDYYR